MGRSPCCSKVGLHRGPWTAREDALLTKYIQDHGEGQWRSLPKRAGLLRCGKSCRLRWMNYLRPDIKRGNITPDEDDLIIRMHALLGNRWSLIAGRLPGRTDNEIKNYWNTHLSKKLRSQGIDPITHKRLPVPLAQTPKKRRSNRTKTTNSKNKQKNKRKVLNNEVERTKVHNPKPIRFPHLSSSYVTINCKAERATARESFSQGLITEDNALDSEIVGAPWSNYNMNSDDGVNILIQGNTNDHDLESHVPPLNYSTLDTLYEEYLQLLETEEIESKVDACAESLIHNGKEEWFQIWLEKSEA